MTAKERHRRARRAGASGSIQPPAAWEAIVDRAAAITRERYRGIAVDEPVVLWNEPRPVPRICAPDEIPVRAQVVLDVEAAYSHAEQMEEMIRELISGKELSEAVLMRLSAKLEEARTKIAERVRRDHLQSVPPEGA